ncbi:hypothetical protein A1O1_04802 [Capronia coronata CBS 617.96]|uniref:FAS1 domain-containing protein n=1 Tax=Capronia coronata CBS 617.96 TaxID=1182541 RepID=W9YE10_9EURO|nr:uncharacterized protein A1O1_04802 [Capronia coronata CBS 617.96]EXJ87875.1 hypothetical protein A1O1_04802 [Capronia coronata CBS 617.96]
MSNWWTYLAFLALAACGLTADQDVLTILRQQSGIGSFTGLLEQDGDLVDILNQGTFSVIVPDDQAMSDFIANNPNITSDANAVRALLQYHIANGTHPSATFGLQPLFVPTLLTDTNYTNVTGGQVVELSTDNSQPAVISGVKAVSRVQEAVSDHRDTYAGVVRKNDLIQWQQDIFYLGGLIHIVDSVLTIPLSFPATITKAGLTDLIALLNKGGWLNPSSPAVTIVNTLSDLTVFAPNSSQFGASFTGWDGLSATDLLSIFKYSISQRNVQYSSEFKNNSKVPTLDGISATMTEVNNGFYVDASHITTRDYITSNGVLQLLDSPLNPNTTNSRPFSGHISSSPSSDGGSGGLSAAAGAGIGIALGVLILGGALIVVLYIRTKRRRRAGMGDVQRLDGESRERVIYHSDADGPPPTYELETKSVVDGGRGGTRTHVFDLQHPPNPPSPLEIDGIERSRINITIEGSPPRHLGFQARY